MMHTHLEEREISMLRAEIEMLMSERQSLLKIAGTAALLVAKLDNKLLPHNVREIASQLSAGLNDLSEETLSDALDKVRKKSIDSE
jgi:hypothetical protein